MKKLEVISFLGQIAEARQERVKRIAEFDSGVTAVMSRLLHEAARNYMSAEEVAKAGGFTVKRVRQMMRDVGLNPRDGKNLLSKKAAEALSNNAALLGVEPGEMDLMSPLAYLPMGEQMRRELQEKTVSKVTGFPETLTDEEWEALDALADDAHDASLAEELWPGFLNPGGNVLRLGIEALLASRARA